MISRNVLNRAIARVIPLTPQADISGTVSFKVEFSFPQSFINSITLDTIRAAYKQYDRRIRVRYTVRLYKKDAIFKRTLREITFVKKWILYWTRAPDILEKYKAYIWPLGVDEEGRAVFFNDFDEAKRFIFTSSAMMTVTAPELGVGESRIGATVKARIWRHTFAEAGTLEASAEPVSVQIFQE